MVALGQLGVSNRAHISPSQNEGTPAPALSVLMGVHNGLPYLPEAVESILSQTFTDFEFVIVDDGSTDGSGEWLEAKAKEDPRIRLVRQENIGLTKSLNRGLTLARGEFVARMDGDDVAMPRRFELQIAKLRSDESVVLLGSEVEIIDETGCSLGLRGHVADPIEIRRRLLTGDGGALTHPAVMFRASAARAIGGYDENMTTTQDIDFFLRMSEQGEATNLPDVLVQWRQHPNSSNHTKSATWAEMRRYCVGKAVSRIGIDRYLEQLFPHMAYGFPRTNLDRAHLLSKQGRYLAAAKLYGRALRVPGQRLPALQGWCEVTFLRFSRGFWSVAMRFRAATSTSVPRRRDR